jgi:hypothetical protein
MGGWYPSRKRGRQVVPESPGCADFEGFYLLTGHGREERL